ncbi:centrosomal protein of 192 kDa isoform X1 [Alosa sapidissima]|uniref:centrosomal protein of 192 kDa isoform X1 n=1 Tax=Alosa sapidissima TaxID=34773 RepID=UPI001C085EFD|nr:centrosomal protein of 192 kDa isoform X1 [Alosa sapidissima]XP_041963411.1 centrosomal protein of 192 kDa isoform X1 [Alosa sapidissima]XP_041963413.1 centrosomal protein of 192 kDa isoform X1 [Alosa sapidissima]XP_041963414.1 centrosomal protein of 192 kDa isoform X1 [Alosa sapidissima]
MMENFGNIVDESFPSLLSNSTSDQSSLENLTLGPTLGIPVAASTVAKIRANRIIDTQASYLEDDKFSLEQTLSSEEKQRFSLSFKDDLGDAENFFADNCFSDMLVKVNLEESKSKSEISNTGLSDEDIDAVHLQDELKLYFDTVVPSAMQRGPVDGLDISTEGESKRLNFRPGLEGGESNVPALKSLESEHRHCDEDQAVTPPVTGAVGRECSNGNEENINEGLTTHPQSPSDRPSTNNEMRVLDIVDGMGADSNDHHSSAFLPTASIPEDSARPLHHLNPFKDTRDSTAFMSNTNQSGHHLSKVLQNTHVVDELSDRQENPNKASGLSCVLEPLQGSKEDFEGPSLDPKYLSQSFHDEEAGSWSHFPEDMDFHQGESEKQSVVYQNEEGKWVTDLAYYSSFQKELESNLSKELSSQFQKEDFVSGSDVIEKITEDQEVFEKENRFIQEEQMEANGSLGMGDSSWKLPTSSHILMRASQISSDFERGNHSYLRLSLGEFFQQRSEALGCLGYEEDTVKRPSFGYIITSPEKREPFALIRPSDFSSRGSSFHSETIPLSDADEPMNAEDLEKTLEDNVDRTITNIDVQSALTDMDNLKGLNNTVMLGKDCDIKETTVLGKDLPKTPTDVQLSISTIASAIANASLNSDPAQLAAMIIELSQKSHFKVKQTTNDDQDASILPHPSSRTAAAQANIVGNISTFDMEKYLKRVELSASDSDVYSSQSCVDLLGLTDGQDVSHRIVEPPFENNLEAGTRNSTEAEHLFNERTRSCSSRILSTSSDGTEESPYNLTTFQSNGRKVVTSQPKNLPTALKMSSSLNCNLPNTREAPLKSKLLAECKPGSGKSEVAKDPATDRSKNDATVKLQEVCSHVCSAPASDTQDSVEADALKSSPEHNAPTHAQSSFRPSTSPLTHSSPSQTSILTTEGVSSYESSEDLMKTCPRNPPFPELHISNLSMSRLTYLSINDGHGTPDQKKNTSMELSTTIIRASPTPEEEEVKLRKDWAGVFQDSSGNILEPSMSPNHTPFKASDPTQQIYGLGAHSQNSCNFHQWTKDFPPDSRPTKNCSEIRHCAYVGDSGYTSNLNIQHQQGGITGTDPRSIVSQHWHGISGHGMQSAPTSSAYMTSDLRYAPPISNYTSHVALLDVPRTAPVPLSRGAVFSTHSTQQYLDGEVPPHMSIHLGGGHSTVYPILPALPGGYAQIQNPHQCFSKSYSQQGITQWVPIDFTDLEASVVVPDELKFPSPCCVGIASQIPLSIFNPTDRWLQVSISISSLSIDGEQVDLIPYQWIVVKNKTVVCPKSTEEQTVLFIAPQPGVYQCTLNVQSWPASAETVTRAKLFSKRILFGAVAENPAVEAEVGKSGCLDFGDLPAGSSKALPLRLINRTHAVIPIRLFMSANATSWRCFTFSKSSVVEEVVHPAANRTAPSVVNYVLHASNGDNPGVFMIWVHFHAPQKYMSTTGELGPADELTARIDIEVDSPGPSRVIQSVGLKARSGTARVHAPRHLQTVSLQAPFGQSTEQTLPLKNAGNINVQLRLKSSDSSECFYVKPSELMLHAGEEQGIVVSFTAKDKQKCIESVLTILVLPSGPQYEVILKGEVQPEGNGKAVHNSTTVSQCQVPPILSNKQFMVWGGVTLGRAMQQKLVLRNNSTNVAQQLRLLVRGQDQDCFQLQSSFGPEERLSQHRELTIRPKEDMAVHLLYTPTRVACMLAKLEIKQSSVRPSQPGIKFTIPLSGYGGTSNVILEDLEKYSEGYMASLTGVKVGSVSKLCLCVRNTGSRAAYVKAVIYTDLQKSELAETTVFSLAPSQFVLKERTKEVITVLLKTSPREQALCQSRAALLATVCLFCGDEISRQQYRRFRTSKPLTGQKVLSDDSLLKNVPFDETFLGEDEVHEVFDLPQRPSDAQIFFNNMNKVLLSLLGTTDTAGLDDHLEFLHTSQRNGSELDGGFGPSDQASHVSLDVLPVKGPPLVAKEAFQNPTDEYCGSWRIKPEQVVLRAPTIGGVADICQVQIVNNSGCELSFELSWPAHCLTITPQNGVIEPESHMQIHISPNPSLISKPLQLPWNGHVYVLCDGQQKFVKVQIQQNMTKDVMMSGVSDKSVLPLVPQAEIPALPTAKIQPRGDIISQIEIINRILVFPITPCGESTECSLKVENKGKEVRWYLSSLAPPYVKGVDGTGDVYRATYTAFRCPKVSGILGTQGNIQVPFTFLPRDEGDYAQFWDLECHPVGEQKQKSRLRFQLCGTGVKSRASTGLNEGDPSVAQLETSTKPKMRPDSKAKTESEEAPKRGGVYAPQDIYTFPVTRLGLAHTLKVNFRNNSFDTHELTFCSPRAPFHIKHSKYSLRSQHYINLPVQFKPTSEGSHVGFLVVQVGTSGAKLSIQLVGEAIT